MTSEVQLKQIALEEAEAKWNLIQARKALLLAQETEDAGRGHDTATASSVTSFSSSSSVSFSSLSSHSPSISPLHMDSPRHVIFSPPPHPLRPPLSTPLKRSRMLDSTSAPAPTIYTSADSAGGSDSAPPRKKKARRAHGLLTSAKGTKVHVSTRQRQHWLFAGHCAGDRSSPVDHYLKFPPAYFPELDDLAKSDSVPLSLRPVREEWEVQQPEVVSHVTNVLLTHSYKVSHALATTAVKRGNQGRRMVAASDDNPSEQSASDSSVDGVAAPRSKGKNTSVKADSSDWSEDYKLDHARPEEERWGSASQPRRPVTNPHSLMADDLYVEIVRMLLDPRQRLDELHATQPALWAQMKRLLLHRHRFQLFWARVHLVPDSDPPNAARVVRLIPLLCHVDGKCKVEKPEWSQCKRAIPLSQVALLLDKIHSGGAHFRDNYATLLVDYKNIPRKAVLYFASVCHGCKKVSDRVRNKKPPRAIVAETVRQRYVLDLIDLQSWQRISTGKGKQLRYVAHMVDHSSKFRWARPLAKKSAELVMQFVSDIFEMFGHPALLHTDNGTEFVNRELEAECRRWGTYCVHGRPYHPESQGAIERPNGSLQRAMDGYHHNHREVTDWAEILSEVMRLHNQQVHSVTRLSPQAHFNHHNTYSRDKKPIPADKSVVLTVAQVEAMEQLSWVTPRSVSTAADASSSGDVGGDEGKQEERQRGSTPEGPSLPPSSAPSSSSLSHSAGPLLTIDPTEASSARLAQLRCLPRGQLGSFSDPGWDLSLGACISLHLRPRGTLAQGDCGPDSASMSVLGESATPEDAARMREEVLAYMLSKRGRTVYAACREHEKEQVAVPLEELIEEARAPRDWVAHDWFTCFGMYLDLNVFVLSKLITRTDPVSVTYGIRLVTNAGSFVQADRANTVVVYFQGETPQSSARPPGHWESVWDQHGEHMWEWDHPTVQHCLLIAAEAMKLQVTRRLAVDKMLTGAQSRINNANEEIKEGDIVWLAVPDKIIDAARSQLRKTKEQQYADKKILVKVWKVTRAVSRFGRGVTEHFHILSQDGLLSDTYPIDELERCPAPPLQHPIIISTITPSTTKRVALVKAYKAYCRWDAARSASTIQQKKTLGVAKNRPRVAAPSLPLSQGTTDSEAATLLQSVSTGRQQAIPVEDDSEGDSPEPDEPSPIPCTLCHIPLTNATSQSCMFNMCSRPFCAVNASCSRSVCIDGILRYCSMPCAQKDGKHPAPNSSSLSPSQPPPPPPSATTTVKPSFTFSQEPVFWTCNTCLLPMERSDVKIFCDRCGKYVHKKEKGHEWCTREGWDKGGTVKVDRVVVCIQCRWKGDDDWKEFIEKTRSAAS
jgi:transposase InsO family protein